MRCRHVIVLLTVWLGLLSALSYAQAPVPFVNQSLVPDAVAPPLPSNTWYVDGVNGVDTNDCKSSETACQTIGHAISLTSSGDTIRVAPATYTENLAINKSLRVLGSDAATTTVDGNQAGTVFTISSATARVILSKLTIRNGSADVGGGINNSGALTITDSIISGNSTPYYGSGGGFYNAGTLTIDHSAISGNLSGYHGGGIWNQGVLTIHHSTISGNVAFRGQGGGIYNISSLAITNSTFSGNSSVSGPLGGGGIYNGSSLAITNSTFYGNLAPGTGGAILNERGSLTIKNGTISGNTAGIGGGLGSVFTATSLQNTIVAANVSWHGGDNCIVYWGGTIVSHGYNLGSDDTCNLNGPGDLDNTDPMLGGLGNNGGPTQTMRPQSASPAIDAGNPNGCTNSSGNLLTTDQRGWARPGKQDIGRCDIGAFERQED